MKAQARFFPKSRAAIGTRLLRTQWSWPPFSTQLSASVIYLCCGHTSSFMPVSRSVGNTGSPPGSAVDPTRTGGFEKDLDFGTGETPAQQLERYQ
jgi:hypothetical protein